MAAREYQGMGGMRLHLDEPLSGEMAKQVAKGHLVPVADNASDEELASPSSSMKSEGHEVGPEAAEGLSPKRPNANSKVDDWRAYAVSLGMDEGDATDATKAELQEWVKVAEDAAGGSGD